MYVYIVQKIENMHKDRYKEIEDYLDDELADEKVIEAMTLLGNDFRDEELSTMLRARWNSADADAQKVECAEAFESFCKTTNIKDVSKVEINSRRQDRVARISNQLRNIAAVLVIPLIIYSILSFNSSVAPAELNYVEFAVANGDIDSLRLPDNSLVVLNSGSKVIYPVEFGNNSRQVFISGEGYFEVTKDSERPFLLSFGNVKVKVLGTKFNVQAYDDMNSSEVSLVEGSVEMSVINTRNGVRNNKSILLSPGDVVSYDKSTDILSQSSASTDVYSLWQDGSIYFKNLSFGEITKQLERLFDKKILLLDPSLNDLRLSLAYVNDEPLENILSDLSDVLQINIQYSNKVIIITKK